MFDYVHIGLQVDLAYSHEELSQFDLIFTFLQVGELLFH
jgi:hypothetical protein